MVLQPMLAGFLLENPHVQLELTSDEGFVDIVERAASMPVRGRAKSLQRDIIAVPQAARRRLPSSRHPSTLESFPVPTHLDDLVRHNCVRFRFAGTGAIHKWEFQISDRIVEYEVKGNLTISDTLFSVEAALEGVGLAYTFEQLALAHIKAKRLRRVLAGFLADVPWLLPVLPQQAPSIDETESVHRLR